MAPAIASCPLVCLTAYAVTGESASIASSLPETTDVVAWSWPWYWSTVIAGLPAWVHFLERAVMSSTWTVAFWTAEKEAFLGVLSAPDKFQAADAYNYWFAALLILILGPGIVSADALIGRWYAGRRKA